MIVDDRLDTVLQTQAAGRAAQRTQLRQLVDLLGRTSDSAWTDRHAQALARIDALHCELGDSSAGILIGQCTLAAPRLVAHLAERGPRTALAAIARARLTDAQWLQLVPALPIHARGALRHRRDLSAPVTELLERLGIEDFVLAGTALQSPETHAAPVPSPTVVALPAAAPPRADAPVQAGIGAIVRRIEAFRRTRQTEHHAEPGQTRLPFAEDAASEPHTIAIDIVIDAAGTITAAEGVDPALLVGHTPFVVASDAAAAWVDPDALRAFHAREPLVAGHLMLDGAPRIAGGWRIDAMPRFGSERGQFLGYRARLRRLPKALEPAPASTRPDSGPDSGADTLQQLLHELRTPINAIQGFAELIQQQLLGATPHYYRSLAASIAADAARLLAGFEDVERLLRIESGRARIEPGEADLAAIVDHAVAHIGPMMAPREIRLRWTAPGWPITVAIDPDEAERTIWRLLSTLIGAAAPGERLTLTLDQGECARLTVTLPAALAQHDNDTLFAPDVARGGAAGMMGHGFALALVAAEVRSAGGHVARPGAPGSALLELVLPLAAQAAIDQCRAAI